MNAVTRFSGRPAPEHPGGIPNLPDRITREAYSHEVSSAGFWAGGGPVAYPAFYSYAYPEPAGFAKAPVRPEGAFYQQDFREFTFVNAASLHARNNPQFFKGTVVEKAVAEELAVSTPAAATA